MIENHEITLIRTNRDDPNFNIKNLIVQIRICIKEVIKNRTKKSLIDNLSKRLLELEFKSNHSIQSKSLKYIVKNILPNCKKRKTHNQK